MRTSKVLRKNRTAIRLSDKKAAIRVKRIRDFDIKSKIKQGLMYVTSGLDWVSEKMKEKVDPLKYSSEKAAQLAEKQKLKDLSTIRGLLKEIGSLMKNKAISAAKAGGNKLAALGEKIKSLIAKTKEKIKSLKAADILQGAGIVAIISGLAVAIHGLIKNPEIASDFAKKFAEKHPSKSPVKKVAPECIQGLRLARKAEFISEGMRDYLKSMESRLANASDFGDFQEYVSNAQDRVKTERSIIRRKVETGKIPAKVAKSTLDILARAADLLNWNTTVLYKQYIS